MPSNERPHECPHGPCNSSSVLNIFSFSRILYSDTNETKKDILLSDVTAEGVAGCWSCMWEFSSELLLMMFRDQLYILEPPHLYSAPHGSGHVPLEYSQNNQTSSQFLHVLLLIYTQTQFLKCKKKKYKRNKVCLCCCESPWIIKTII